MDTLIVRLTESELNKETLDSAGAIIKNGGLVAFPTETVYGLGGDALNASSSKKIYEAKGRPSDNPLIVHIARFEDLDTIAKNVPYLAKKLIERLWPGPLTIILKKKDIVPYETTGGLDTVAVRFPSHRIAQEFIKAAGGFVAAPSANISGRPSTTKASHVIEDMDGRVDMIIDGGDCEIGLESTIIDFSEDTPELLRPGFYNKENIEDIVGEILVDPVVKGIINTDKGPKAPGMKYRHYAPKASLSIIEGEKVEAAKLINSLVSEKLCDNKKCAILCFDENAHYYDKSITLSLGSIKDEIKIARNLFDALRKTDELNCDYVFSETFDTPRFGKAIMNRLVKAAGYNIIKVEKEN